MSTYYSPGRPGRGWGNSQSQWWRDARAHWDALPDKTWEEGTGFVDNPEKRGGRFWIFNYLGQAGKDMAGQAWRRALEQGYKAGPMTTGGFPRSQPSPHQIKTALQQQYAADRGKPTPGSYPTGPSNILKVSSATKPKPTQSATTSEVAPSGPMKIGGTKKKTGSSTTMTSPLNL